MSRIDEALRRRPAKMPSRPVSLGHQRHFASAWDDDAGATKVLEPSHVRTASKPVTVETVEAPTEQTAFPGLHVSCGERLVSEPTCDPLLAEQYRRLGAVLHRAFAEASSRVLMVTSAAPADGKTLTAINLAMILSDSYRREVLLIDADLNDHPLELSPDWIARLGLSEALRAQSNKKLS